MEYSESCGEDLARWIQIVPELLRLFDDLQFSFPALLGGRFGKINEVRIYDEQQYEPGNKKKYRKSPSKTLFLARDMKYEYPIGWLFPLFAGMRVLVGPAPHSPEIRWKTDPFDFWSRHGGEICTRYQPSLKDVGYEPKRLATSSTAYQAVRIAVTDLYKGDLLAAAGIAA